MRMLLVREQTVLPPADPDKYRQILEQQLAQIGKITGESEKAMLRVLDDARKQTLAELGALAIESPSRALYERTLEGIDEAVANLAERMNTTIAEYQKQGFAAGVDLATKPIAGSKGFEVITAAITQDQLQVLSTFSADLIQDMTTTLRSKINSSIVGVVAGAKTPTQAAREIGASLTSKNHFSTIAHRARAITVTEVGRAHALATQAGQQQLEKAIADAGGGFQVKKQWLNAHLPGARETHLEAEGRYSPQGDPGPIPVDDDFEIAGFKARYPRDPNLPPSESVNCHCVSLTVVVEGDPEIDDEPPPAEDAEGLTAGQKFGPALKKDPDQLYVNADTGKAYAKKTPIYDVDGKLQTASGQPVITKPKTIAVDTPDQKVAAQTAYTQAKVKAQPSPKAKDPTKPALTTKMQKVADDPYTAAGLKAEKPLTGGSNGYGGEPMTKALGYDDPKMSGFVWDGDLGGWRHPNAPAGKQLPDFKDLKPHEQKALLQNAGVNTKAAKAQIMKTLGLSDDAVDLAQAAKPPVTPKPNLTPTPPPPTTPSKAKRSASAAKANAELAEHPRKKPLAPPREIIDGTLDPDDFKTGYLLPDNTISRRRYDDHIGGDPYRLNTEWKTKVMTNLADRLEDAVPSSRFDDILATNQLSRHFGSTPAQHVSSSLVSKWAHTSGDSDYIALALQRSVAEVFDLPWPPAGYQVGPSVLAQAEQFHAQFSDVLEAFIREMHAETQDLLNELYPDQPYVRLIRGFNHAGTNINQLPELDEVVLNPASSFSVDTDTSGGFGGTMLLTDVPKERILGTPFSGFGCLTEYEYVVVGAPADAGEIMAVAGRQQIRKT